MRLGAAAWRRWHGCSRRGGDDHPPQIANSGLQNTNLVIAVTGWRGIAGHNPRSKTGDIMRKLFILYALAFGLVTVATVTVMATAIEAQTVDAGAPR
jgi:hypothetical protein